VGAFVEANLNALPASRAALLERLRLAGARVESH
jgi:hypothetical protein